MYTAAIDEEAYLTRMDDDDLPFVFCDASSVEAPKEHYLVSLDGQDKFVYVPFVDEKGGVACMVKRNRTTVPEFYKYIEEEVVSPRRRALPDYLLASG